MRKEPFTVNSIVHVIKRGSRGTSIVRDDTDRWRFVLMLRHFNDEYVSENWFRDLMDEKMADTLNRPSVWLKQKKLVNILCYNLLDNHFHLLLQEIQDGGIAKFMQKIGIGMTNSFNQKYKEKGSLFQGAYRSRTVEDDVYFRYVSAYIQIKNSFELYQGGIKEAFADFDRAYNWVATYPYCSLGNYAGIRESPLIDKVMLSEMFTPSEYKTFSRDFIDGYLSKMEGWGEHENENRSEILSLAGFE